MRHLLPWTARPVFAAFLASLLLATPASGEMRRDPATVTLAADLRESPGSASAAVVATVSAGQRVDVLEMRGEDALVDAAGTRGWMPLSKLRLGAGEAAAGSGGGAAGTSWLRGLSGLLGGGGAGGDSNAKVPIGVRGLQREDVAGASPDPRAVERMEAWRVSPDEALAFARAEGLESYQVDYPEAPAAATSTGTSGSER